MWPADLLDGERLQAVLAKQRIGRHVVVLGATTSTNDAIAAMAQDHEEGLVVFAEQQTAGRGQYGRRWESARGKGLWLSILLRPQISVRDSGELTEFLARTIASTIEQELALAPIIKPPNDIFLAQRKVAGVLVEMRVETDGNYCAIAGVGINVNQQLADFPTELRDSASSLALASGRNIDRTEFAIALLRNLDSAYAAAER